MVLDTVVRLANGLLQALIKGFDLPLLLPQRLFRLLALDDLLLRVPVGQVQQLAERAHQQARQRVEGERRLILPRDRNGIERWEQEKLTGPCRQKGSQHSRPQPTDDGAYGDRDEKQQKQALLMKLGVR